ncbi:MAG TPA: hypothetical protein VMS65_15630, partial [Polyangiaceae bacterium]|nr:hypothetical protein [Polyangiaceae bacterium]
SVRALRPELPQGIEAVVDRCLQKATADRYQTIAEFAEALGPFAEDYSRASIARVRGTVRRASSIPPAPIGTTTLKSLEAEGTSGVPRASPHSATEQLDNTQPAQLVIPRTDTLVVGRTPNPEPAAAPKSRTVTAFGTSQSRTERPRRFVVIAAAVAVALAAAAWRFFASETEVTRERSTASEGADPRSVAPSETQRSEPTAAAPTDPARPVIEPAPSDAERTLGSAPPMPEHAVSASTHPKTHAPVSTARPRERHPLDGRR